ncbi:ABC transporter substrate-binding protein [Patescibacteria group bacterium]|nr:MAG: ABC transporter substrate-binding protein [Patescibacteria group bacterium]
MKNKYIFTSSVVVVLLLIISFSFFSTSKNKAPENTLQIGMLAPLTGPGASLGEWTVRGATFAANTINKNGGVAGKQIELVVEDDGCTGKTAIDAAQKLLAQSITQIVGPLCGAARVPVLSANAGSENIFMTTGLSLTSNPNTNKYAFNVLPAVSSVLEVMLNFIYQKNPAQKISLIYTDDEYGKENQIAFNAYTSVSGKITGPAYPFPKGSTDLRTQILKIKNDHGDIILMTAFPPEYAVFMKQARELGLSKPIFAVSSIQTPEVAQMNAQTGQKVYYSYPRVSDLGSVKEITDKYKTVHPEAPASLPMYFGSGYDAVILLATAMKQCGTMDNKCIQKQISSTTNYSGANGRISFNEHGDNTATGAIEIRVLEKGVFSKLP